MEKEDPERAKVFARVKEILEQADRNKAMEFLNGQGEPQTVARRYLELMMDFYWKARALSEVTSFGTAGIDYSLAKAQEFAQSNPEAARDLKSAAMAMAYNLASFTWPGWDEEGIVVSDTDLATGLEAAKLNLRLARELKKGASAISAAYWVVGAQYLAAEQYEDAGKAFEMAIENAREAGDEASALMNSGYAGIVKVIGRVQKAKGKEQFEQAIEGLKKIGSEDAKFYAQQLEGVLAFFSK